MQPALRVAVVILLGVAGLISYFRLGNHDGREPLRDTPQQQFVDGRASAVQELLEVPEVAAGEVPEPATPKPTAGPQDINSEVAAGEFPELAKVGPQDINSAWMEAVVKTEQEPVNAATMARYAAELPAYYNAAYQPQGSPERRDKFTLDVQEAIWRFQNPPTCEHKFAIVQNIEGGMGSLVHVAGAALAWAINRNRILVLDSDYGSGIAQGPFCGKGEGKGGSFHCFIVPLSNCSVPENAERVSAGSAGSGVAKVVTIDGSTLELELPVWWKQRLVLDEHYNGFRVRQWWRGEAAAYFLRLNERTSAFLRETRVRLAEEGVAPLPLPENTVSVHVRLGEEAQGIEFQPWSAYANLTSEVLNDRQIAEKRIFLSTEEPNVVTEAARAREDGWDIFVLPWRRGSEDVSSANSGDRLALFSLANLFLALEAQHFVGTRSSNWNRLIDELRKVWPADQVGWSSPYADVACKNYRTCKLDSVPRQW